MSTLRHGSVPESQHRLSASVVLGQARPRLERMVGRPTDERWWATFLAPVPAWIHVNLLQTDQGVCVLTVRRSRQSVAGGTAVNVSMERHPLTIEDRD